MISEKKNLQTDFEGKKFVKNAHGAHCYVSGKIFLTPEIWEKSSYSNKITHTPLLHKSHMVNHIGGGGRGGLDRALGLF